ncbi:Cap [Molossus molossus associated gemykibivirus 1]|nr:Cap [Molossus molossus associated gemykibivirus 1]
MLYPSSHPATRPPSTYKYPPFPPSHAFTCNGIFPPLSHATNMPRFTSRRSRYSRRRPYRRSTRRTRTIRRRPTSYRRRRTTVSRRRILQVASEKKQDSRITFSNVDTPLSPPILKAVVLQAGQTYMIPYIPTAQDRTGAAPELNNYRSRSDVYMRGYKERIIFNTNGGSSWHWRRICWRMKGPAITTNVSTTSPLWLETAPYGFVRSATNANGTALGSAIQSEIFKGQINVDWFNLFTAPLDTNRISVAYDQTRIMKAGNNEPYVQDYKMWHPMNKNFYYRDDENGDNETTSPLHSSGLKGMGDYYILDLFASASSETSDVANVGYEGTLYWHER